MEQGRGARWPPGSRLRQWTAANDVRERRVTGGCGRDAPERGVRSTGQDGRAGDLGGQFGGRGRPRGKATSHGVTGGGPVCCCLFVNPARRILPFADEPFYKIRNLRHGPTDPLGEAKCRGSAELPP